MLSRNTLLSGELSQYVIHVVDVVNKNHDYLGLKSNSSYSMRPACDGDMVSILTTFTNGTYKQNQAGNYGTTTTTTTTNEIYNENDP